MSRLKRRPTYKYERLQAQLYGDRPLRALRWAVLAAGLLAGALLYVRLRSGTESHRNRVVTLRHDLAVRKRELENLRLQQETLTSGRYIRASVRRMGLNLCQAQEGQVRRMVVLRDPPRRPVEAERFVAASER